MQTASVCLSLSKMETKEPGMNTNIHPHIHTPYTQSFLFGISVPMMVYYSVSLYVSADCENQALIVVYKRKLVKMLDNEKNVLL